MLKDNTAAGKTTSTVVSDGTTPLVITSDATAAGVATGAGKFKKPLATISQHDRVFTQVLEGKRAVNVNLPIFASKLPLTVRDQFNIKV